MKVLVSLLLSAALVTMQSVIAHEDHGYRQPIVISEGAALIVAQRTVASMSRKDAGLGFGRLSESWSTIPRQDLSVYKKGIGYFVVAIPNQGEAVTLYVLMSDAGEVYDANMLGQFDGID